MASSVAIIFLTCFEFFSTKTTPFFYLSLIVIAGIIPVIIKNFANNKKVFLGDSGSLFLGCLISLYIMYVLSNDYLIKDVYDINKILTRVIDIRWKY